MKNGGKRIATAHAGQILVRDAMFHLSLLAAANRILPAPGNHRGVLPAEVIAQMMYLLHAGGRHMEDLRDLSRDGLFSGQPVMSPDTLANRLVQWGSEDGLARLDK